MIRLSASQLGSYLKCPAKYMWQYLERIPIAVSAFLVRGISYHAAAEHNYKFKIATGDDQPLEDLKMVAAADMDRMMSTENVDLEGADPGAILDGIVDMVEVFRRDIAPTVQPALVEERFDEVLDGVRVVGYVDLVDADGVIRDNKTASKKLYRDEAEKDLQLTVYSALFRKRFGHDESGLMLDRVVDTAKGPVMQQVPTRRTDQDMRWLGGLLGNVVRGIQSGVFPPNPYSKSCGQAICPFWDRCIGKKV